MLVCSLIGIGSTQIMFVHALDAMGNTQTIIVLANKPALKVLSLHHCTGWKSPQNVMARPLSVYIMENRQCPCSTPP